MDTTPTSFKIDIILPENIATVLQDKKLTPKQILNVCQYLEQKKKVNKKLIWNEINSIEVFISDFDLKNITCHCISNDLQYKVETFPIEEAGRRGMDRLFTRAMLHIFENDIIDKILDI